MRLLIWFLLLVLLTIISGRAFSYLPDNISRCVNIVFATEFSAYAYQHKNKIIKMLFDRVIFKG
ncbi:hypothetical protein GR02_27025 [Escherichia coli]|nr:hypothetical protein GR02_27025 [Escherichia coli]